MTVEIIRHENWAEVVLSRPERKNAITGPLGIALAEAMNELNQDDTVQLALLRGAGGAFCSGLDLKEFNADPAPEWLASFQTIWRNAHRALFDFEKPIIGALERYAINGGAALAIACDILVAGEKSFLQVGEVQLGMAAPYNLAWLNVRHSEAVIAEVTMIGDRLAGEELVRLGLAQRCVVDDDILSETQALCEKLAGYPAGALGRIKQGIRAGFNGTADEWFDRFIQQKGAPPPKSNS
ncbi:MAG: enoyl-CoA hydratase/isomerase family protein [Pseudomonadota bacterium]